MGQITFRHTTNVMITTRQYDWLNRLRQTISSPTGPNQPPWVHGYDLNAADQRTRIALGDGSFWVYDYDSLGQVKSGKRYWSDGTPVAGQQFEYAFDDIGNRNSTKAGGDQLGAGLRSADYTNNTLNQITGRGVPGAVDVVGVATPAAAVAVNGTTNGVYRRGDYFRRELTATNSTGPQWLTVGVTATSGGTNTVWPTGYVLVPPAGQTFLYDADGNLTNDAVWSYTWDAENRLVQMTNTTSVTTSARKKLVFQYDHQARRIRKTVYPWGATDYSTTPTLDLKFLYDNWNLLAELNATNNAVIRSCMWGIDLSGSEQGAGGVGGLLRLTYYGGSTTNAFVAHDGNGNVSALVEANGGTNVAEYVYGPFAEPLVVSGPMGKLNPFRFSTKYTDDEAELLYYGYRYYAPGLGRWLNRDPLGEHWFLGSRMRQNPERARELFREGHRPDYLFASQNPAGQIDRLGLDVYKVTTTVLCSTPLHRKIVGDDGAGGCYTLEFFGQSCWYSIGASGYHLVGRGHVEYQRLPRTAAEEIQQQGYEVVVRLRTDYRFFCPGTVSVDAYLAGEAAARTPSSFGLYVFLLHDCGTFANSWLHRAEQALIDARESWPAGPPLPTGPPL